MEKLKIYIDKYKIFHIAIVLLIVNLAYIMLIKNPQEQQLLNLYQNIKDKRLQLIQAENYIKELNERLIRMKESNDSLKKFYTSVLKNRTEGIVSLRKELAELLRQVNIFKIDINYNHNSIEKYNLHEVSITLPIENSYANIRKFINSVENSKNFIVINGVSLTESKQQLKLEIKMSAFFKEYGAI